MAAGSGGGVEVGRPVAAAAWNSPPTGSTLIVMNIDDMILISIDDHVIEPPDMFEGHVPAKWADQAPRLVTEADGTQYWEFQGARTGNSGLNAVVTWPP